jgi:hypothetical protein
LLFARYPLHSHSVDAQKKEVQKAQSSSRLRAWTGVLLEGLEGVKTSLSRPVELFGLRKSLTRSRLAVPIGIFDLDRTAIRDTDFSP